MATQVTDYELEWNPSTSRGIISASDSTGQVHRIPVTSAAEFIAVAIVFGRPAVAINQGVLTTGKTPVGK